MCKNSQFGSGQGNHSFENDFPVNRRNDKCETIDNHNLHFGSEQGNHSFENGFPDNRRNDKTETIGNSDQ